MPVTLGIDDGRQGVSGVSPPGPVAQVLGVADRSSVDLYGLFAAEGDPAILLPGYVAPDLAAGWAAAVASLSMGPYVVTAADPDGAAFFFGANVYDVRPEPDPERDLSPYFAKADEDRAQLAELMRDRGLPHPIDDVLVPLVAGLFPGPVALASEKDGRKYYAGVARATQNGIHHHVDDGPLEAPELVIGTVKGQVSIVIYVDTPADGSGELCVFHKRPTPIDYAWNRNPKYGFDPGAVRNSRVTRVCPHPGDVVIFDAWCIHRVAPSSPGTRRLTISCFFGLLPDGGLIFWS